MEEVNGSNGANGDRSTWRERERERAREEILESAAHVFAQSGYDGSGMKEIAARAGISVGMLYNHFKGKEDIFQALLERYINGIHERGNSCCEEIDSPIEEIRCRIRSVIEFYWENRNLVLIYLKMNPVRLELETSGWERITRERTAVLITEAMKQGEMTEEDPQAIAALIIASIHRLLFVYVNEDKEESIHAIPDIIDRIILKPLEKSGAAGEEGI